MRIRQVYFLALLLVSVVLFQTLIAAPNYDQPESGYPEGELYASPSENNDLPKDPDEVKPEYEINAFPNPNAGKFKLEISGPFADSVELVIINVSGKKVYNRSLDKGGELFLNLTPLRKGIYFAQIRIDNKVISHPIIYAYDE